MSVAIISTPTGRVHAMTEHLVQVDLRSDNRYLTCWIPAKVKVGQQITLKNHAEPVRLWEVLRVGEPRAAATINRGWNNNI